MLIGYQAIKEAFLNFGIIKSEIHDSGFTYDFNFD